MQTTLAQFNENQSQDPFSLQNHEMLRLRLSDGPIHVRGEAVVATQGPVEMAPAADPDLHFLAVEGSGQVFLGECGHDVHLVRLEDEAIVAGGPYLLAFMSGLEAEVTPTDGANGLVNTRLSGTGWVALRSDGAPVLLDVTEPDTIAEAGAVIAWSDRTTASAADGGARTRAGAWLAFGGSGWVLVQPSAG